MSRYQSIISAIISAACIFLLPWLNRHGVLIDEGTLSDIIVYVIAACAFIFTAWRNHNITSAAQEGQALIDELKANGFDYDGEEDEEVAEDETDV